MTGPLVVAASPADEALARACAGRLGAARLERAAWEASDPPPVVVWCDAEGPGLRGPPRGAAVRRPAPPPTARPGRDPLLRALGRPAAGLRVADATAGWGVDAGVMAAAGAAVVLCERSPAMALLLEAALARWRADARPGAERMTLLEGDAVALLGRLRDVDVVFLDPLFPDREASTTSGAGLRWLRDVAAWTQVASDDGAALLDAARACAGRRVVVKRGRNDPYLAGVAPSGSVPGRTTRYDLYAGAGTRAT